jgi:urease accessory protein
MTPIPIDDRNRLVIDRDPEATADAHMTPANLYRLLAWLSPAYPIGAFSYSHGLEAAIEAGLVRDRDSLAGWITGVLAHGTGRVDGALFAAAWRAARQGDDAALDDIADLAAAWRGSAEMALESRQQGASFLTITRTAWPEPKLGAFATRRDGQCALPVAVAVAAAGSEIALEAALTGYLHAFAANLCSAAVRAIPLGQSDGQRALAALAAPVDDAVARALAVVTLDDVGTAAPLLDWCSMRHETQYTRLFRS